MLTARVLHKTFTSKPQRKHGNTATTILVSIASIWYRIYFLLFLQDFKFNPLLLHTRIGCVRSPFNGISIENNFSRRKRIKCRN